MTIQSSYFGPDSPFAKLDAQGENDLAMSNESMTRAWDHPVKMGKGGLEYWTAKVLEWDRTRTPDPWSGSGMTEEGQGQARAEEGQ